MGVLENGTHFLPTSTLIFLDEIVMLEMINLGSFFVFPLWFIQVEVLASSYA